ncbi:hypothetical protein HNQ51_002033 [Inhella inkyongensis]|uniref:Uncharacterized protein n=1 Tax=Inhella inkyongensis TaxID=392593 RepID=A0A840S8H7_9BURK|nr:hypothetical protein [Inhella inkyongensis]MBB5204719.1 hypothetical protein [Inhella inkyongensis]
MRSWGPKLAALLLCVYSAGSFATTPDPLWVKVVRNARAAEMFVARDIDQKVALDQGAGRKEIAIKLQQTAWQEGEPVYTVISSEPKPKESSARKPMAFDAMLKGLAKNAFDEQAAFKRQDHVKWNGTDATEFELNEGSSNKLRFKLWAHPENGEIYAYHVTVAIPLVVAFDMKVQFADTPMGLRLGVNREINFESKMPFKSGGGHVVEALSNWVTRPN